MSEPREWWIETHETLKDKNWWPQVFTTDVPYTVHVIEYSAYEALVQKLAGITRLSGIVITRVEEIIVERDQLQENLANANVRLSGLIENYRLLLAETFKQTRG